MTFSLHEGLNFFGFHFTLTRQTFDDSLMSHDKSSDLVLDRILSKKKTNHQEYRKYSPYTVTPSTYES